MNVCVLIIFCFNALRAFMEKIEKKNEFVIGTRKSNFEVHNKKLGQGKNPKLLVSSYFHIYG